MKSKRYSQAELLALLQAADCADSLDALRASHGISADLAQALWQRRRDGIPEGAADDGDSGFSARLQVLLEVLNELTTAPSFDELCRTAATLAVSRLGFERIGIWFCDEEPGYLRGSFGVGEDGTLRDERWLKLPIHKDDPDTPRILNHEARFLLRTNSELRDGAGNIVGYGTLVRAPLWDGEDVIGYIATDNHFSHNEIIEEQCDILALFAVSLGHLCSIHRTAEALRQSESRLRLIMEQAPALMWTTDRELLFTSSMGRALASLGLEPGQTTGMSMCEYFGTDDPDFAPVRAHYEALEGRATRFEQLWEGLIFQVSVQPLRDRDGEIIGTVGVAVDITDIRHSEEERRKLEAQVQHAQKLESLGVLAGGIAHDFNNLLVSMLGNAELAQLEIGPQSSAHRFLEEIGKAACRAADLCKQMLAYSGKGKFLLEMVDLNEVAREMAGLMGASLSKNTAIEYALAEDLPAVEGDVTQLRQVVMNLVTNASEALEGRQGTVKIATGVAHVAQHDLEALPVGEGMEPGEYVFLEVSDTGCGMEAETRERIFDPFFSTKFTGRGLGLAAVLGIVRSHDGGVQVDSAPGEGTTFRVLLPGQEAPAVSQAPTCAAPSSSASGTILIIDDEEQVREMAGAMLDVAGYTVLMAGDGESGIKMLADHAGEVDVVLLDMSMPGMDGAQAYERLRLVDAQVPIVLCSGYGKEASMTRFEEGQLAGFLAKPFLMNDLLSAVNVAVMA